MLDATGTAARKSEAVAWCDRAIFHYLDARLAQGSTETQVKRSIEDIGKEICKIYDVPTYSTEAGYTQRTADQVCSRIRTLVRSERDKQRIKRNNTPHDLMQHGSHLMSARIEELNYPQQQPFRRGEYPGLRPSRSVPAPTVTTPSSRLGTSNSTDAYVPSEADVQVVSDRPLKRPRTVSEAQVAAPEPSQAPKALMSTTDNAGVARDGEVRPPSDHNPSVIFQAVQPPLMFSPAEPANFMSNLQSRVMQFALRETKGLGIPEQSNAVFQLELKVEGCLSNIYSVILGPGLTGDKRITIAETLRAEDLVSAIIGAFLHREVFEPAGILTFTGAMKGLRSALGVLQPVFEKEVKQNSRVATDLEEIMRHTIASAMGDEAIQQKLLAANADSIAARLCLALRDHLTAQCAAVRMPFDAQKKLVHWQAELAPIIMQAMALKCRLTADHHKFRFRWVAAGEAFEAATMESYHPTELPPPGAVVTAAYFSGLLKQDAEGRVRRLCGIRVWTP